MSYRFLIHTTINTIAEIITIVATIMPIMIGMFDGEFFTSTFLVVFVENIPLIDDGRGSK